MQKNTCLTTLALVAFGKPVLVLPYIIRHCDYRAFDRCWLTKDKSGAEGIKDLKAAITTTTRC